MKVQQFYNKNQFLIVDKGEYYFQSYDSLIAKVDREGDLTLYEDWDYSNTTRKHLYLFIETYTDINFYECKNKRALIQAMINCGQIIKGY